MIFLPYWTIESIFDQEFECRPYSMKDQTRWTAFEVSSTFSNYRPSYPRRNLPAGSGVPAPIVLILSCPATSFLSLTDQALPNPATDRSDFACAEMFSTCSASYATSQFPLEFILLNPLLSGPKSPEKNRLAHSSRAENVSTSLLPTHSPLCSTAKPLSQRVWLPQLRCKQAPWLFCLL
jgi:hypothetical protein